MKINSPFEPAWWLRNRHFQTLWSVLCRRPPEVDVERERLSLPDGDFLDLLWTVRKAGPIVVILHGLEGSFDSHYVRGLMYAIAHQGWRGVLMHFRGCSGEPNRLARSYHSGDTGDIAFVVDCIKARYRETPVVVVGFSLGGNVLLKWLGEGGRACRVNAAVAVSVPLQLDRAVDALGYGFSRVYQWYLVKQLTASVSKKFCKRSAPFDLSAVKKVKTLRQFDDIVTAPLHGFNDADHYYAVSSSKQYLKTIAIPTLVIHAIDDPFLPPEVIPAERELSDAVEFELSSHGGHVGFVGGPWPWRADYVLERRILRFFADQLALR